MSSQKLAKAGDVVSCKRSRCDATTRNESAGYFEDVASRIASRRCELIGRQKNLRERITTMERSIPALLAYNMWKADERCQDAPYCKIREIMKRFSPYPDPTDELLERLKSAAKNLNEETAELHDKIIDADIKLEETNMELESMELVNKEIEDNVKKLEKEVHAYDTPSLHSIHSEDLICLTKIRQLATEELSLKSCIKELETRELFFREQMDRLLASREFQAAAGSKKMVQRIHDLENNEKRMHCALQTHKQNMQQLKRKLVQREKELTGVDTALPRENQDYGVHSDEGETSRGKENTVKSTWGSNWWSKKQATKGTEHSSVRGNADKQPPSALTDDASMISCVCSGLSTTVSHEKISPLKKSASLKCKTCSQISSGPCQRCARASMKQKRATGVPSPFPCKQACPVVKAAKSCCCKTFSGSNVKSPCSKKLLCEPPSSATVEFGFRSPIGTGKDPERTYDECSAVRKRSNCRCNCKGKCARGLSDTFCNCGGTPTCPADKGYQPTASRLLAANTEDSNSDDEFCECCSCGCDDNNEQMLCRCD